MPNKPNRNDPCKCGSGKKYKHCCQDKDNSQLTSKLGMVGMVIAVIFGLIIVGMALSGSGPEDCPPGQVWSEAHQHCH